MLLVVMGVAGAGKSTLGAPAAEALGWPFLEADDLHPPANVARMRAGHALTDGDREPWLEAVAGRMARFEAAGEDAVVACSALKACYRARLRSAAAEVRFVLLELGAPLARSRIAGRPGHFMSASLVDSQFEALERPAPAEGALSLDAAAPLSSNVAQVLAFAAGGLSATP